MKIALTHEQQLERLKERNLGVPSDMTALEYLRDVNYYRFSAYARPFQIAPGSGGNDQFSPGTTLEHVRELEDMDRQLRRSLTQNLEHIEIAIRSLLAYSVATKDDPSAYYSPGFYTGAGETPYALKKVREDLGRANEDFLDHHRSKNGSQAPVPIWAAVECFSFGTLSAVLSHARQSVHVKYVARRWSLNDEFFKSLVHHLSYVRNVCAHYNRLWNRRMSVNMKEFHAPTHPLYRKIQGSTNKDLYQTLVFVDFLTLKLFGASSFGDEICEMVAGRRWVADGMGFPAWHDLAQL